MLGELLSKICKELNNKQWNKKWAAKLRNFFKEEIEMTKMFFKVFNAFHIREVKIKTTLRFHLLAEWSSSWKQMVKNDGQDVKKGKPYSTDLGNVNWYSHYGIFSKSEK